MFFINGAHESFCPSFRSNKFLMYRASICTFLLGLIWLNDYGLRSLPSCSSGFGKAQVMLSVSLTQIQDNCACSLVVYQSGIYEPRFPVEAPSFYDGISITLHSWV